MAEMVVTIKDSNEKRTIARSVLEALTEWFEVEESREGYIQDCADWFFRVSKIMKIWKYASTRPLK